MKTTIRINRIVNFSSPASLLVNAGYYYYNKKGGGHSYKHNKENQFLNN